jgi:septation ring formation regulator EzrA
MNRSQGENMSVEKVLEKITSEFERVNTEHIKMMEYFSTVNSQHEDMITSFRNVEKEHEKMSCDLMEIKDLLTSIIKKLK